MLQRVLVVDDEPSITATLSLILENAGFEVQSANSGSEALEMARSFGPDALITDYAMPDMNGFELAAEVIKLFPGCRIVVFSGQSRVPADASLPSYQMLRKPVPPGTFVSALKPEMAAGDALTRPPRVLYIDDVESHRYSVARLLRLAGFEVAECSCGSEAFSDAARNSDVILLDVGLPDISGFEVCRILKAHQDTAPIPVIHITASHLDELDRNESLSVGAYDYIPEPFDPDHLLKQVRSAVQLRYLGSPEAA